MMLPQTALHPQQHLPLEPTAAQTPAPAQRLERLRIGLLPSPPLHPLLKALTACRRILLDCVLAQPPVNPDPPGPMSWRRQVPLRSCSRDKTGAALGP